MSSKPPVALKSKPQIRTACSREGVFFLVFVVGLACAAVYTAKNALILLACFLVIFLVASVWVGRNNVKCVSVARRINAEIFAERETHITLLVKNAGFHTRYALQLFEDFEQDRTIGPIYVSCLRSGDSASSDYDCVFQHRGVVRFRQVQVRSRFPLPFFEFRATYLLADHCHVYPARDAGRDLITFDEDSPVAEAARPFSKQVRLQELQYGHQTGRILWKQSARRGEFVEEVQRFAHSSDKHETIRFLDKHALSREDYEKQISQVTDYALNAFENDKMVSICVNDKVMSPNRRDMLEFLSNA